MLTKMPFWPWNRIAELEAKLKEQSEQLERERKKNDTARRELLDSVTTVTERTVVYRFILDGMIQELGRNHPNRIIDLLRGIQERIHRQECSGKADHDVITKRYVIAKCDELIKRIELEKDISLS